MPAVTRTQTGEDVEVELLTPISSQHLFDHGSIWLPEIHIEVGKIVGRLVDEGRHTDEELRMELARNNLEDKRWVWERALDVDEMTGRFSYAALIDGELQGMMYGDVVGDSARADEAEGQGLIYIERLSVAPWNRCPPKIMKKYAGLGSALVVQAVELSFELEFLGRVGLHSSFGAENFYRDIGFREFGSDIDHNGLVYFELESSVATTLVGL